MTGLQHMPIYNDTGGADGVEVKQLIIPEEHSDFSLSMTPSSLRFLSFFQISLYLSATRLPSPSLPAWVTSLWLPSHADVEETLNRYQVTPSSSFKRSLVAPISWAIKCDSRRRHQHRLLRLSYAAVIKGRGGEKVAPSPPPRQWELNGTQSIMNHLSLISANNI